MSEQIKDGGPAFPRLQSLSNRTPAYAVAESTEGMTLRDYFIAHAPDEPQPWFRPVMPTARMKMPPALHDLTEEEKSDLYAWDEGYVSATDITSPRVRDYALAHERARSESARWDKEHEKQRYVQWPSAWADAMLAAREPQS
ncbi:hypothetical protein [Cupriavidus taiwanensis]|uniref:hypothetical protein n=1 Tax=Cupriavidus taiwanensis TaxID=164546 RepID=UPI000E10AA6E|nr:hypothetical protein [Cupriavidus taiwanensis]SOY56795.1 conserved hypothetical protein [Cupriavidus taiwanensis]SOY90696.1 conserved hypothetical protein [Cupriavidus taiwanensis]SOZ63502.1 conserved hypothetical protein [Cupriavidus taiwanensis]SOZ82502.1 conserved hypothetical protein [Cupriavidus taiwanensis]SOZ84387.1 conserved hypothetical protein [Cupriavidus taiwanensis]